LRVQTLLAQRCCGLFDRSDIILSKKHNSSQQHQLNTKGRPIMRTSKFVWMPTRRQFLKASGALAAGVVAAPAVLRAAQKVEGEVYVESWGGSYAEAVKNYILEPFKAETGVDYKHAFFGNNSEQLAKLKTGKSRVDMTFLSDSFILRGVDAGVLQPIDTGNVPNYGNMFESFRTPPYDPGPKVYCASYFYGDQAIAYNEEIIKETPTSWEALWDTRYKGHVVAYGSGAGPIYLGQAEPAQMVDGRRREHRALRHRRGLDRRLLARPGQQPAQGGPSHPLRAAQGRHPRLGRYHGDPVDRREQARRRGAHRLRVARGHPKGLRAQRHHLRAHE
jgi:hypothetical protein